MAGSGAGQGSATLAFRASVGEVVSVVVRPAVVC